MEHINKILVGNALNVINLIHDNSVDCIVTSPPYYGLRHYSTSPVIWGGLPDCIHEWIETSKNPDVNIAGNKELGGLHQIGRNKNINQISQTSYAKKIKSKFCKNCNTWLGDLGREPSVDMYIEHLVEIFRECRKKLKDTGTFFLNIGDTYCKGGNKKHMKLNMFGVPWRLSLALQKDGWILREDIIWHKLNTVPLSFGGWRYEQHMIFVNEDVDKSSDGKYANIDVETAKTFSSPRARDAENRKKRIKCPGCERCSKRKGLILRRIAGRPTPAHEYIFMFSKTKGCYYDAEAVKQPMKSSSISRNLRGRNDDAKYAANKKEGSGSANLNEPRLNVKYIEDFDIKRLNNMAHLRDVWSFSTGGGRAKHFAMFPIELPKRCILAGTSQHGNCNICGAPYARVLKREGGPPPGRHRDRNDFKSSDYDMGAHEGKGSPTGKALSDVYRKYGYATITTTGWLPTCECENNKPIPAVVLDCFIGAGNTGRAAIQTGRNYIGIELNKKYAAIAEKRILGNIEPEHEENKEDKTKDKNLFE